MHKITRRALLQTSLGVAAIRFPVSDGHPASTLRKGRIQQSVSRWCYAHTPLDQLAEYAAKIGLKGIDLLQPDEYEVPRRYGLLCTMGYAGGGEIKSALNRSENHAAIEEGFRANIPRAAKAGV